MTIIGAFIKNDVIPQELWFPPEMQDFKKVLEHSAKTGKYPTNNWLTPNGINSNHKSNCASMFRHLAQHTVNPHSVDGETQLHPLLHLACRALMEYCRIKRGIIHELDK